MGVILFACMGEALVFVLLFLVVCKCRKKRGTEEPQALMKDTLTTELLYR